MLGTAHEDKLKLKLLLLYLLRKRGRPLDFSYFFFYFFKTNLEAPSFFFRSPSFFLKSFVELGLEEGGALLSEDNEAEEDPSALLGSRRAFCRSLLYFFKDLPTIALEEGYDAEDAQALKKLSFARGHQLKLISRVMHEHKADPLALVHDWMSDFLEQIAGAEVSHYEFLEPKNLEFFLKQGTPKKDAQEELLEPLQSEAKEWELGMLQEGVDLSEVEDATLSVLGDPNLGVEESSTDLYNFFFLKTREVQRASKRPKGLFFFDQSFFFCEEEVFAQHPGLFSEVIDPYVVAGGFQTEYLDELGQPDVFEPSMFEDLEEASIEALFFGTSELRPGSAPQLNQKQALLEDYFVDEFSEALDDEEDPEAEAEAEAEDPIEALVLEDSHLGSYADEETSSSDDEVEAPMFEKNFLPFFFVLKRLRSFFFFKNIFSFFFFFLPLEFFNLIYGGIEEGLLDKEAAPSNFFFNTLRGPRSLKELNKTPLSLTEVVHNYVYEPSKQGKHRSFFFFLFLSRFFNHKFKEDFCLSVVSSRALQKDFGFFLLKYSATIRPFFEHMMFSFNTSEFLEVFFLCLKVKDLSALATYVKTLFERIQIKFHKVFLRKLDLFLTFFFEKLRQKFGVKGFFMDVRGKVSVVGNSKKRHVCIKKGYLSKTKKELRFFFMKNQINTTTGVLGASYLLSY